MKDINEKVKLFQTDIDLLDEALSQDGLDDAARALLQSQKRSKIYQQNYQKALQRQISGILDKMHGDNYATIDNYLNGCYETGYIGTLYDIAGQGIPIIAPIDQAAVVKAVQLDSKISNGLYSALGMDIKRLKKNITQEISRGIASSLSYSDISRNLKNISGVPLYNAKRIVRTESHRIQQQSTEDSRRIAKNKGADIVRMWDAALDGRTRDSHARVDGEIRELDEKFSNGLMFPGDPSGSAAEVINCRCVALTRARWALDDGELRTLKDRAAYFGLDKAKNFEDYKKKYLKAVENSGNSDIISPAKNAYGFKTINGQHDIAADIASNGKPTCNPKYGSSPEYSVNCQRCVQTYEFRRRGFDVVAKPKPQTNNTIVWGSECFTDPSGNAVQYTFNQTAAQVRKEIKNAPDGARYGIYIKWKGVNSAHVFVAEKENGVVRYLDPQVGNLDASSYFSQGSAGRFGYFRMDDKQLTTDTQIVSATMEGHK